MRTASRTDAVRFLLPYRGKPPGARATLGTAPGLCAASPYRIEAQAKDDLNARLR